MSHGQCDVEGSIQNTVVSNKLLANSGNFWKQPRPVAFGHGK